MTLDPNAAAETNEGASDAERRINALIAQRNEAKETAGTLQSDKDALAAKVLELQDTVSALKAGSTPDPFSTPDPTPANADIAQILDEKFKAYEAKVEAKEQERNLRATLGFNQQQSFQNAQREFPELQVDAAGQLSDEGKAVFQAADRIMRQDPTVASHPNGPYMAVLLAKGALAGQNSVLPAAKAAASTGPTTGTAGTQPATAAEANELRETIGKLKEDMRLNRGDPGQLWAKYRDATIKLGMIETPDKVGKLPPTGPQH
jgi:hypothetical protein